MTQVSPRSRRKREVRALPETSGTPLPIELYRVIFTFVRAHGQAAAARLPLICQALRLEAEEVLYHAPLLKTQKRAMVFGRTVFACPRRANAVRELAFNAWPGWEGKAIYTRRHDFDRIIESLLRGVKEELDPAEAWMTELRSSLAHLHRLATIVIRQPGARHVVLCLLEGLDVPLRRLKGTPIDMDFTLQDFPDLEEIHLSNDPGFEVGDLEIPKLRILSCPGRTIMRSNPVACPTLTHLSVTKVTSEDIYCIVCVFGPQLVSLRVEQSVWDEQGRLYPTNGPQWQACTRLKYLNVRHYQWFHDVSSTYTFRSVQCRQSYADYTLSRCLFPQMSRYLHDDAFDVTNVPPSLQTLVWQPAWTRVYTYHMYPDEEKHADVRRFAEAIMWVSSTLTAVIYEWTGHRFYKCYLTPTGCGETEARQSDVDSDAWTYV